MSISIKNSYNTGYSAKTEKTKKVSGLKGSLKAAAIGTGVTVAASPVGTLSCKGINAINKNLDPFQKDTINKVADTVLFSTGLERKGVKIENIRFAGLFPNRVVKSIVNGKNAFFCPENNRIFLNQDKIPTAVFHEMGHAFNKNCSKLWSTIQNLRTPAMMAASLIMLFGALSKKEVAEDGKELTKGQKIKNTVRNNAGILAFGTMIPVVLEEGMASIRGCKWANANLTKDLAKKVRNTNIFGAISYVAIAAAMGIAAQVAVKIKDDVQDKAKAQQNNLVENKQDTKILEEPEVVTID